MAYQNQYDITGRASTQGFKAEEVYKTILEEFFDTQIKKAQLKDELRHIDYFCDLAFEVDVKSIKDPETIWIELLNVQGKQGWLYGDCSHFAFERTSGFIMVKKSDLQKLIDEKVDKNSIVEHKHDCLYKLYTRKKWGRKDLLTCIKPSDLLTIPYIALKK